MRVAVPYEDGLIGEVFESAAQFMIFDIEDKVIKNTMPILSNGMPVETLCKLLKMGRTEAVLCRSISEESQSVLKDAGIRVSSNVDPGLNANLAVFKFIYGRL